MFITIPSEIIAISREFKLTMAEKEHLAVIYGFSQGKSGKFEGSYEYLSYITDVSRDTAIRAVNKLLKKGLIIKIKGDPETPNKYEVNIEIIKKYDLINYEGYSQIDNTKQIGSSKMQLGGSSKMQLGGSSKMQPNNNINNINNIYDVPKGTIEEEQPREPDSLAKVETDVAGNRSNSGQSSNAETTKSENSENIGKKYSCQEYRQYVDKTYQNKTEIEKLRLLNKAIKEQWEITEPEKPKTRKTASNVAEVISSIQIIDEPETRVCPICGGSINNKFSGCEKGCGRYVKDKFVTADEETNTFVKMWLKERA